MLPPDVSRPKLVDALGCEGRENLPNMCKVGLRLCIGVDEPSETNAAGERASLGCAFPLEPEVLSHCAAVVGVGHVVAVAVIGAVLPNV